jgi:hypothetical protein
MNVLQLLTHSSDHIGRVCMIARVIEDAYLVRCITYGATALVLYNRGNIRCLLSLATQLQSRHGYQITIADERL